LDSTQHAEVASLSGGRVVLAIRIDCAELREVYVP
jgi:hypothetical protein